MTTANQFIDPNVYLSTSSRFLISVSLQKKTKQKLISNDTTKSVVN